VKTLGTLNYYVYITTNKNKAVLYTGVTNSYLFPLLLPKLKILNIRSILRGYYYNFTANSIKTEKFVLMGKPLVVTKGTCRTKMDMDDAWMFALMKNHKTIYDIGANSGFTGLLGGLSGVNKTMVLIDPNASALTMCASNLIKNNLSTNKMFITSFVGEKSGDKIKFYTVGAAPAGSMFKDHITSASAIDSYILVDTLTVDDIIKQTNIVPDFVKIDVEGAESYVMNGAGDLAAKQQTKFFIEMHKTESISMKENTQLMLDWAKKYNYSVYYLPTHSLVEDSDLFSGRGKCHILLIPANQSYPEYLRSIKQYDPLPESID